MLKQLSNFLRKKFSSSFNKFFFTNTIKSLYLHGPLLKKGKKFLVFVECMLDDDYLKEKKKKMFRILDFCLNKLWASKV
jgi:hypothetical protein